MRRRPLVIIGRLVCIVAAVATDEDVNLSSADSLELVALAHEASFPPAELFIGATLGKLALGLHRALR